MKNYTIDYKWWNEISALFVMVRNFNAIVVTSIMFYVTRQISIHIYQFLKMCRIWRFPLGFEFNLICIDTHVEIRFIFHDVVSEPTSTSRWLEEWSNMSSYVSENF